MAAGRVEETQWIHHFDAMVAHVTADGKLDWMRQLPGNDSEVGYKICFSNDGNLLVAGYIQSIDGTNEEMYIAKCDLQANLIWRKTLGTNINDRATVLLLDKDDNIIVAGGSSVVLSLDTPEKMLVYKLNQSGEVLQQNTLNKPGEYGYLFDAQMNANKQIVFAGICKETAASHGNPVLILVDDNLEPLNQKWIETPQHTKASTLVIAKDNSLFLAGISLTDGLGDCWLGRTSGFDPLAQTEEALDKKDFVLFPNPFHDFTYLKIAEQAGNKKIQFFNPIGQTVKEIIFEGNELLLYKTQLPGDGLFYFNVLDEKGKILHKGSIIALE